MARFVAIPSPPIADIDAWEQRFLNAIKQNIDLLIGNRGASNVADKAVLTLRTNFPYPAPLKFTNFQAVTQYKQAQISVVVDAAGNAISPTAYGILRDWTYLSVTTTTFDLNIPTGTNLLAYAQDVEALSAEIDAMNAALDNLIAALQGRL